MPSKTNEIDTAARFLRECGVAFDQLLTLKEFAQIDIEPSLDVGRLDSCCPDVVAISNKGGATGIELTAYSDDESRNRLDRNVQCAGETALEHVKDFRDLHGFTINFSPNQENVFDKRSTSQLVRQLLEFVRWKSSESPFQSGQTRHFSVHGARAVDRPFAAWNLLDKHVQSIVVCFQNELDDIPVILSGSFGTHFGTRRERLVEILQSKATQLKTARRKRLDGVWLLIHAAGNPRSSRIAPIWRDEVESLMASPVRQAAIDTGYDRVFLWDGVRGGFIDLVTGESQFAL